MTATPPSARRIALSLLAVIGLTMSACGGAIEAGQAAQPHPTGAPATPPVVTPGPTLTPPTTIRPAATPTVEPEPTPAPASPTPGAPAEPFAMNLHEDGDFVAQYTFEWCVGASLQMALLIEDATDDRSKAYQSELWAMARDRSFSPFGGANPRGWTAALNDLGIGPYELVSLPTFDEAVRVAAAALRTTERPVGLVMWRGRHAWVMSGFESLGDPATGDGFEVTGARVLDPLFPHGSSRWGPSPAPNSLVSLETLGRQFVLRDSRRVNLGVPPGYLLVLPTPDRAAADRKAVPPA